MKIGGIYAEVRADTRPLETGLKTAEQKTRSTARSMQGDFDKLHTNKFKDSLDSLKRKLDSIDFQKFAIAAAGAIASLSYAMGKAIKAASDLQETTAKFNTVFAGQEKAAKQFENVLTKAYAMSTQEARAHLSAMQDLLVPMGMNASAAAQMSGEVVKLSADLGSFNNLPTAQVMGDIQSALVGNYETMKKYGVVLNESTVSQKALASGLAATKGEITSSDKAMAAYKLIIEGSTFAIGDMARTSDSYANTVKRAEAAWKDFVAAMGEEFLPIATEIVKIMADTIPNAFETIKLLNLALIDGLVRGWLEVEYAIKGVVSGLGGLWNDFSNMVLLVWVNVVKAISDSMAYLPFTDSLVKPMQEYEASVYRVIESQKGMIASIQAVGAERQREIEIHNKTIDGMVNQILKHNEVATVATQSAATVTAAQTQVQTVTMQTLDKWLQSVEQIIAAEAKKAEEIGRLAVLEQQYRDQANAKRKAAEEGILENLKFTYEGYLDYRKQKIEEERVALEEAGVAKELVEQNYILRMKDLYGEYWNYQKEMMDRYQSDWEAMNQEMGNSTTQTIEKTKSLWEQFVTAWGDGSRGNGYIGKIIDAWARGEDLKVSISEQAKNALISKAGALVSALWDAMIEKLVAMIGSWIGLGSAQSGAEGENVWKRIANALGFAGSVAGIVGASKSVGSQFAASGGWLANHPIGGWINQGSGTKDDVFLGNTGNINHWGMGGEFVVNKKSARKHAGLLHKINQDVGYADGGPFKKPFEGDDEGFEMVVDRLMAGGIKTWWEQYVNSGNVYQAILETLKYFGTVFAGSFAGKAVGQNWKWADGGVVPDQSGAKPASFFGDLFEAFKRFNKQFTNSMSKIFAKIPFTDLLGAYSNPIAWVYTKIRGFLGRDILEEVFDPARRLVRGALTALVDPGNFNWQDFKPINSVAANYPDGNLDAIIQKKWNDEHAPKPEKDMLPTSAPFAGFFKTGGMLPFDGLYYGHAGEQVIPADSAGRPMVIHVHVGSEEFAAYVDQRADNIRVKAERRGLGYRRLL